MNAEVIAELNQSLHISNALLHEIDSSLISDALRQPIESLFACISFSEVGQEGHVALLTKRKMTQH